MLLKLHDLMYNPKTQAHEVYFPRLVEISMGLSPRTKRVSCVEIESEQQKNSQMRIFFGDSDGTRTHDTAVKGRCLNHLTTEPLYKVIGSGGKIRTFDLAGMNRTL